MSISLEKTSKAYELLKNYNGPNSYLIDLKNDIFVYKKGTLNDFQIEYILNNHDFEPIYLNKIIKIAKWFGEKKQSDWNIEFVPEKLLVGYYLGETETTYHMYVRYRRTQPKMIPIFIPKKALLNPLFLEDFNQMEVDFAKYNQMGNIILKPHQEEGVKFLLTRKKCILAHQCGGGKSLTAIVGALEGDFQKILVICPASVKPTWFREINRFLPEDEITIVEGSTWKENRFTIINYDILDNFYEIPMETVKRRVRYVDDMGNIKYKYEEKEVVSKKGAVIKEAMANSQLFQMEFDCVIIDEAHRLSNANSGRYKIISDLLKRSQPNYIWELTGTMITNNPMNLYNILKIIDAEITNDWINYVKTYCDGKQIFVKSERDKLTYGYLKKCGVSSWYDLNQNQKAYLNQYLEDNCKKIWLTGGSSNLDELKERIKHLYLRDLNEDIYKNFSKETIVLSYDLTNEEKEYYDQVWEQYVAEHADEETDITKLITNKKLIESSVLRQATSQMMVPYTIKLAEEVIEKGEKVIIFCAFDKEIYALQEHFGDKCVVHNGKITAKNKEKVLSAFTNDENVTVFLGNLVSSSVGLTLTAANNIIFNSVSWLPAENQQAEYRILRIGQTRDCKIFYQKFANTYHEKMFEILDIKNEIIDSVIVDETQK